MYNYNTQRAARQVAQMSAPGGSQWGRATSPPHRPASGSGLPFIIEVGDARIEDDDEDEVAARNIRARVSRARQEKTYAFPAEGAGYDELGGGLAGELQFNDHNVTLPSCHRRGARPGKRSGDCTTGQPPCSALRAHTAPILLALRERVLPGKSEYAVSLVVVACASPEPRAGGCF